MVSFAIFLNRIFHCKKIKIYYLHIPKNSITFVKKIYYASIVPSVKSTIGIDYSYRHHLGPIASNVNNIAYPTCSRK